jgi:DNA-binding response OmpR family regulator
MKRRILLVEDDAALSQVLSYHLVSEGFVVEAVFDGETALNAAEAFAPDLVLLDLTLPGTNGFELCSHWRQPRRFGIIIITSRDRKADALHGFELGADDYVTKPFDLEVLVARIQAVLRRARPNTEQLQIGNTRIDFANLTANNGRQLIDLTPLEFQVLHYLAERPNCVVSRLELMRYVWGYADEAQTRSVDMGINRLRKKLETDPHHPRFLQTARGGYVLAIEHRDDRRM